MNFEIIAFPGLVFLAVALAAKLIERRRDVLYGPYIAGRKDPLAEFDAQLVQTSIGLRRNFARFTMKFAPVSCFASAIIG
jgi:hypothetical protein